MGVFEEQDSPSKGLNESYTQRYIRFKAWVDGVSVTEAARRSLSRVWKHINNLNTTAMVITAFRADRPTNDPAEALEINRQQNKLLESDLRNQGWGFFPVLGGFVENADTPRAVRVEEESYFAIAGKADTVESVTTTLAKLCQKYEQDAALLKPRGSSEGFLVFPDGRTTKVGSWSLNKLSEYYTRTRSEPAGKQFTFEGAADLSRMTRMAVDVFHRNLGKGTL